MDFSKKTFDDCKDRNTQLSLLFDLNLSTHEHVTKQNGRIDDVETKVAVVENSMKWYKRLMAGGYSIIAIALGLK